MNPPALEAELQKVRQLMLQKQYAEALALYAQSAEQFPLAPLWLEYGSAAARSGALDLAAEIWQKLVTLEPDNPGLLWRVAGEYTQLFLFSKAEPLYRKAAQLDPNNSLAQ